MSKAKKKLQIQTPRVFVPLLPPARYKGAHGGRGSGKSHFFAELLVEECLAVPGTRAVCIREVQKSLKESAKRLIEDKIDKLGVGSHFVINRDSIITPGGGIIIFEGMNDQNAESIKSFENFRIAWVEEAQTLSQRSLEMLRPTIRAEGSELWFSWNPYRKSDPVEFLRGDKKPENAAVVEANWRDNPFFPKPLEGEREHTLRHYPARYGHIWEGEYATITEGAYFAEQLAVAKSEGRLKTAARDPLLPVRAYCDLGGTGQRSDSFVIWIVQFVGQQILVLDYYEAVGQPVSEHIDWLRSSGYGNAIVVLPHDGRTKDRTAPASFESAFKEAGFSVKVIENQGTGAARQRIEAVRRLFPRIWFNYETTEPGVEALGSYHEKRDQDREIGLGPEHDWASHAADGFGLMAIDYKEPYRTPGREQQESSNPWRKTVTAGWMAH